MPHDHSHDTQPVPASIAEAPACGGRCGASDPVPGGPSSAPLAGGQRFRIPAMDCASEESEIRRAVEGIPGVFGLRFQLGERSLRIYGEPQAALVAVDAIRKTGFEIHAWPDAVESADTGGAADPAAAAVSGLPRLVAALALATAAEGLSFLAPDAPWSRWVGLAIAAAAIIWVRASISPPSA